MSPLKYDPVLWLHIRYPEFWIERQTPQCVLTIKLVPWAPALRGPYKVNVKREKCILTRNNKATAWIYINQVEYFILLENRSKKILLWVWHRDRHTELVRMRAKTHEDNVCVCLCLRERERQRDCVCTCLSDPEPTAISSSARRFSTSAIYRDGTGQHMAGSDNKHPTRDTQTPTCMPSSFCPAYCHLVFWHSTQKNRNKAGRGDHTASFYVCIHHRHLSTSLSSLPWQTH